MTALATQCPSVLDAVDRLLGRGAVLGGDLTLSLAGVDLVVLDLRLLLAAVETIEQASCRRRARRSAVVRVAPFPEDDAHAARSRSEVEPPCDAERANVSRAAPEPARRDPASPADPARRLELDPASAERGVARLVLTVIDFIRQLLERQAIRRMEGGLVDDPAVERMGAALIALEQRVLELKEVFGLAGEALDLDLGPLGSLTGARPEEGA